MKAMKYAAVGALAFVGIAVAQFGGIIGPTLVYDPANAGHIVEEIRQTVALLENSQAMWGHIQFMAHQLSSKQALVSSATPWFIPTAGTYGSAHAWMNAIGSGSDTAQAYLQNVGPVPNYGPVMQNVAPASQSAINRQLGRIAIADGLAANAMATSGTVRSGSVDVDTAIRGVARAAYSTDPNDNTTTAVLNTVAGAQVLALQQQQRALQLHAAEVDMRAAQIASERAQMADQMNYDIALRRNTMEVTRQSYSGASAAIAGFRP